MLMSSASHARAPFPPRHEPPAPMRVSRPHARGSQALGPPTQRRDPGGFKSQEAAHARARTHTNTHAKDPPTRGTHRTNVAKSKVQTFARRDGGTQTPPRPRRLRLVLVLLGGLALRGRLPPKLTQPGCARPFQPCLPDVPGHEAPAARHAEVVVQQDRFAQRSYPRSGAKPGNLRKGGHRCARRPHQSRMQRMRLKPHGSVRGNFPGLVCARARVLGVGDPIGGGGMRRKHPCYC